MPTDELMHKLAVLLAAVMIGAGILVGVRTLSRLPAGSAFPAARAVEEETTVRTRSASPLHHTSATVGAAVPMKPTEKPKPTIVVGATNTLPATLADALTATSARVVPVSGPADADVDLVFSYATDGKESGQTQFQQVFAAADRFDTPPSSVPWEHIQSAWQAENRRYQSLAVLGDTMPALESILGTPHPSAVIPFDTPEQIRDALLEGDADLALVPFDQLIPELLVLAVDEMNPLEADDRFDAAEYPLVATVMVHESPNRFSSQEIGDFLNLLPKTNRDGDLMTTVAMTGVTAMVRFTAARMDQRGSEWLAEDVGPELSRADFTVISNEVPFVDGCETDLDPDNVVFCSKPEYMDALLAAGADIVGLTGNHQNDHGPEGALRSLQYYEDAGLQVYGGGADKASAMKPLVVEHNGNRIAFIGANSYGPPEAWASDFLPGSAPFDLNIMSAMIRNLKEDGDAHVVLAELQYQESYDVIPLPEQQQDFRALVRAGADVVTGVQSHVPQAIEFLDGKLILHGLGNFYFDQMWSDDTREGLVVMHTIYDGRHISTRLLPTILYDYGQPRFASAIDGGRIVQRVFDALSSQQ